MSGFYVIIGAHAMVSMLSGAVSGPHVTMLAGILFAIAIIGIVLLGGELFTGNCLLVVSALSGKITWKSVFSNWVIVYFCNFAGSILFSVLLFGTGFYGFGYNEAHTKHSNALCSIVHGKTDVPAYQLFFRSIFANFCVCMAILMSWSSNSTEGKVIAMAWPVVVFVVGGFEHSIANQGLFALATIVNCPTRHGWYWANLAVTTPGNILGACIIGGFYWFAVVRGSDADKAMPTVAEKAQQEKEENNKEEMRALNSEPSSTTTISPPATVAGASPSQIHEGFAPSKSNSSSSDNVTGDCAADGCCRICSCPIDRFLHGSNADNVFPPTSSSSSVATTVAVLPNGTVHVQGERYVANHCRCGCNTKPFDGDDAQT